VIELLFVIGKSSSDDRKDKDSSLNRGVVAAPAESPRGADVGGIA